VAGGGAAFEETIALANLAHVYIEIGDAERAQETAERAIVLVQERGSKIQELENVVALARAEALIAAMRAVAFHPHLVEIQAERARRRADQAGRRAQLAEAHRLFVETGATGHAARVARMLQDHGT
jgi:hypothetical protein